MRKIIIFTALIFSSFLFAQNKKFPKTANIKPNLEVNSADYVSQEYNDLLRQAEDLVREIIKKTITKNYNEAIEIYTEAIRLYPNIVLGYTGRGSTYFRDKNNALGILDYEKAKQLDPSWSTTIDMLYKSHGVTPPDETKTQETVASNQTAKNTENQPAETNNPNVSIDFGNGISYYGQAIKSSPNGKGKMTFADGSTCEGEFVDGLSEGIAVHKYLDGSTYIGNKVKGQFTGEGKKILASGYYYKGVVKNNLLDDIKYYDNKNQEITETVFNEIENKEKEKRALQNKGKLQLQSITIPAPSGISSMTDRSEYVKMQFDNKSSSLLYLWGYDFTFYSANNAKIIAHSNYKTLEGIEIGREVLADFNRNSYKENAYYFAQCSNKGDGYCNDKFQIKINKGKPLGINSDSTYVVSLYNYQKFIDDEMIQNFSFWKNAEERKTYFKNEKENYYNSLKENGTSKDAIKTSKEGYEERIGKRTLTDVHASYDAANSIAHVVFTFKHAIYYKSLNMLFDIDFKNKTYKKIADSDYSGQLSGDCYSYISLRYQDKATKNWYNNYRIINFDDNSTIDIDKAYLDKISNLTNPPLDVKLEAANKEYLIFKSYENGFIDNYYFVNRKSNFCEKIVKLICYQRSDIVWNKDFSKAAIRQPYKLNPSDEKKVCSVSIINFDNLTVQLLDDHQYQMDAINAQIEQNKADAAKLSAFEMRNAAITRENAEIQAQNDKAKAERRAKCTCCHGTGVVENKGMYLGEKEVTTMTINGLQQKTTSTVSTYGASTYAECGCCK